MNGSCHCGAVKFTLQSNTPVPYQMCGCTICRKIGSYAGSVNLGGIASTLHVLQGQKHIRKYYAVKDRNTGERFSSERNFCGECSTMLWLWDSAYPELINPFASAVDTEMPIPPSMVCIFEVDKPKWARWPEGEKTVYQEYLEESLEDWHRKHGMYVK